MPQGSVNKVMGTFELEEAVLTELFFHWQTLLE